MKVYSESMQTFIRPKSLFFPSKIRSRLTFSHSSVYFPGKSKSDFIKMQIIIVENETNT
jgi:hypothetical protein